MKHNEKDIQKIRDLAKELGVDYLTLKKLRVTKDKVKEWNPMNNMFWRGTNKGKKFKCELIYSRFYVMSNGECVPCSMDFTCEYSYGNVEKDNIPNLLSRRNSIFIKKYLNGIYNNTLCS